MMLNPKIKGWAMYHRHVCAKKTFSYVDNAIFLLLWQWAKRRHPNKGRQWIKQKYFTYLPGSCGGNNWMFFGEVECSKDERKLVWLRDAYRIRIRRHTKIRADVNPYDPGWYDYLDRRHRRDRERISPARVKAGPILKRA